MKEYEITYLSMPDITEEARSELNGIIETAIQDMGGSISSNSENVRRRLHFPIKKQNVGFLRILQVTLPADKVAELRETIKKQAGIMRLTILQTAKRADVSPVIFDAAAKQQAEPKKEAVPAKAMTDAEVEEKIEEALGEEVK